MVRCWPVSRAAVFVTFTTTCHLSSQAGSRSRTLWSLATARSARRDDAKKALSSAYSASMTSSSQSCSWPARVGMSSVYTPYKHEDRQLPCGTPAWMGRGSEVTSSTAMKKLRPSRNDTTVRTSAGGVSVFFKSLYNSPECHTRSNAFSISRKTPTVRRPRLCLAAMWWRTLARWSVVECLLRNPNYSQIRTAPLCRIARSWGFHTLSCGCRYGTEDLLLPHARASSRRGYDPDGPVVVVPFTRIQSDI
ncbi:hypothetical protein EVAR_61564_1 [Eumeta japonica]|uniref:Uncharacterized protein n=1 Tax=Eumeta variegata TaxID=151549 RepID=A0A4C1YUB9_EUMVA|nr:hypothetical protein EVAR_61564_1 [Eumeta japonica]